MNFKDQLDKDLIEVFLNADEFTELIELAGYQINAIISSVKYDPYAVTKQDNNFMNTAVIGISESYRRVTYKRGDIDREFFVAEHITMNGKYYSVAAIEDNAGIVTLTLNLSGAR